MFITSHKSKSVKSLARVCFSLTLLLTCADIHCFALMTTSTITTSGLEPLRSSFSTQVFQNSLSNNNESLSKTVAIDNMSVLYESDRILAIDKPEGIPHHDSDEEFGILSLLRQAQSTGNLEYQGRLYGIHRLDRVTSGILLFAKDADTASVLTRAFREGNVTKYYVGVSKKKRSKKKQGWVKGNMARGRRKSWFLTREKKDASSNMAVTRFYTASLAPLKESAIDGEVPPMTCILFRPYTGRTHQLRVAAKSVGLPLSGDAIYSDGSDTSSDTRTCLHASAIHIDLVDGAPITIWSPPPFNHLYREKEGKVGFNYTVFQLMHKHCDCDPILELVTHESQ